MVYIFIHLLNDIYYDIIYIYINIHLLNVRYIYGNTISCSEEGNKMRRIKEAHL